LVGVGLEAYFTSLSPWTPYSFGQNRVLLLTGWQTLTPEFRDQLHDMTGESSFAPAVAALAKRPKTIWLTTLGFEQRINRLLQSVHQSHLDLRPFKPFVEGPAHDELNEYLVAVPPGQTMPLGPLPGTLMPYTDSKADSAALSPAIRL
jgi:hypothetical protein